MDDKVSAWLRDEWYSQPLAKTHAGAVVMATLGRLINWPDSLACLGIMHEWDVRTVLAALRNYRAPGRKVFTGAYIINGGKGGDKLTTVCHQVQIVHDRAARMLDTNYMRSTWELFMDIPGIGSFIAGQIVADLRWFVKGAWQDRHAWAPLGPGSARGMRRMLGLPHRGPMKQSQFDDLLPQLLLELHDTPCLAVLVERKCEAMDLQNCLCEFDKYMRLTNNEGSVRSGYPGRADAKLI